jgi:protein-disulfide isomerase
MTHDSSRGTATRRRVLLGLGAGATVALAGCTGGTASGADSVPVRGNPDADVTLEVYEDFGCPVCRQYVLNLFPDLQSQYIADGLIRYEHHDYIVTSVAARHAANAAREVLDRHGDDAFWAFARALYDNQNRLQSEMPALFGDIAEQQGLDAAEIESAGQNLAHDSAVDADIERGDSLGVSGTPSFVLDGELVDTSGARDMGDVVNIVAQDINQALNQQ